MNCKQAHFIHQPYKHLFTYPAQSDYLAYCDSCGVVFSDPKMTVHCCKVCKDYAMCSQCKQEGMHCKHGVLKTQTLDDYLESSGDSDSSE